VYDASDSDANRPEKVGELLYILATALRQRPRRVDRFRDRLTVLYENDKHVGSSVAGEPADPQAQRALP
jgi:hypothetical protein